MIRLFLILTTFLAVELSYSQDINLHSDDTNSKALNDSIETLSIRKNSIYIELGGTGTFWTLINYDRIIPINDYLAFVPRIGLSTFDGIDHMYPVYELNFVLGHRHYFETGFGQYMFFNTIPEKDYMFRAGYRYHGKKGFLFRVAPHLYHVYDPEGESKNGFWFGISLGYCF
jgi:hypothetical protein